MNRTLWLAAGALALTAARAAAQVNIEQLRSATLDSGVAGTAALSFALRTGNVSYTAVNGEGRLDWAAGRLRTFLVARGDVAFQAGRRFSNAGLAHVRTGLVVRRGVQPEAFAQINYDRPRKLTFRALAGAGIRLALVRAPAARVWFGTSLMIEDERLDLPAGAVHPVRTTIGRSSSYLSARFGRTGGVALAATGYFQPALRDPGDSRVLADVILGAPLARRVMLTTSFDARYDSRPPDNVKSLDTELRSGISVAF